ncbi:glycine betaine ABC transporter substrate-binding protein [Nocardia sp. NPDC052254]|uniref:glycine betaine ABC transporter substrate-binding protein n=1 Tax=Nocardia sp. NPDC052254 TaxID=3155681 RepID=UPI003431F9E0
MGTAGSVRAVVRVLVATSLAAMVVGCSNGGGDTTITVGAGDSAQSRLIAEIYAQALARAGAHAVVRDRLGQRADYLAALDAGTVTVVGDTSGDLLRAFDSSATTTAPDDAAAKSIEDRHAAADASAVPSGAPATPVASVAGDLSRSLPEGLVVSDIADAADLPAQLALAPASAARLPADVRALAPRCGELSLGIATGHDLDPLRIAPDPQRDVLTPLHEVYGCDITRHTTFGSDSELRKALLDGHVDAGVFTSAVALLPGGSGDLAVVADPDHAFRAQNVIPLLRQGALAQQQIKKLNHVAGELTTADFALLIREVRDQHQPVADVARAWLDEHSL